MRPTTSLLGASRLPLTSKKANKDFYKGSRQAYVPGGGHRTGPPGKHVVQGTAKYRLLDERVRYFVGPGEEAMASTELRPYVSVTSPRPSPPRLPSFSPNALPARDAYTPSDFTRFSKRYHRLNPLEKQALVMDARREWWSAMAERYGRAPILEAERRTREVEEGRTREVEGRAEAA